MAQAILLQDVEHLGAARPGGGRLARLPAQLPRPPQARPARDQGRPRGGPAPAARPRRRPSARPAERASETAALLSKTVLTIHHRAGEDGKLYGSVTSKEIGDAIRDARGLKVDRRKIQLESPIHETGTYMVEVEVSPGVTASVKTIVAEEK